MLSLESNPEWMLRIGQAAKHNTFLSFDDRFKGIPMAKTNGSQVYAAIAPDGKAYIGQTIQDGDKRLVLAVLKYLPTVARASNLLRSEVTGTIFSSRQHSQLFVSLHVHPRYRQLVYWQVPILSPHAHPSLLDVSNLDIFPLDTASDVLQMKFRQRTCHVVNCRRCRA